MHAHQNLGHPPAERLSQALKHQGLWFEQCVGPCDTCKAHVQSEHQRPGNLEPLLDFNERVYIVGMQWTNKQGQNYFHMYHMIDAGPNYHVAVCSANRTTNR